MYSLRPLRFSPYYISPNLEGQIGAIASAVYAGLKLTISAIQVLTEDRTWENQLNENVEKNEQLNSFIETRTKLMDLLNNVQFSQLENLDAQIAAQKELIDDALTLLGIQDQTKTGVQDEMQTALERIKEIENFCNAYKRRAKDTGRP